MRKCYNVARVDEQGVEIIQMYPPLTMREAREVRVSMKRTFRNQNYVVINVNTLRDEAKNWEV